MLRASKSWLDVVMVFVLKIGAKFIIFEKTTIHIMWFLKLKRALTLRLMDNPPILEF